MLLVYPLIFTWLVLALSPHFFSSDTYLSQCHMLCSTHSGHIQASTMQNPESVLWQCARIHKCSLSHLSTTTTRSWCSSSRIQLRWFLDCRIYLKKKIQYNWEADSGHIILLNLGGTVWGMFLLRKEQLQLKQNLHSNADLSNYQSSDIVFSFIINILLLLHKVLSVLQK